LEAAARKIERGELVQGSASILDGNGNAVGRFEVVP
jgi:hypothetical protein